jgi:hypothetical protein
VRLPPPGKCTGSSRIEGSDDQPLPDAEQHPSRQIKQLGVGQAGQVGDHFARDPIKDIAMMRLQIAGQMVAVLLLPAP